MFNKKEKVHGDIGNIKLYFLRQSFVFQIIQQIDNTFWEKKLGIVIHILQTTKTHSYKNKHIWTQFDS